MMRRLICLTALAGFCLRSGADVLPPEKLLPKETLVVVTAPDCAAGWSLLTNSSYGRLWLDNQMKPFKDKMVEKLNGNVFEPLQRALGVQFSSFHGLARGQATFALLPATDPARPEEHFAPILILDAKDQAGKLQTNLADIRQKWSAAGKPMKAVKIRDVEFTTFFVNPDDLSWDKLTAKADGKDAKTPADDAGVKPSTNKTEVTFGQVNSLFLAAESTGAIEKILSRQSGGLIPALEEEPAFQADYNARLKGAPLYVWVNVKSTIDLLSKAAGDGDDSKAAALDRINAMLAATGFNGINTLDVTYRSTPEGVSGMFFVGAPEAKRRGLVKAFFTEAKDASPPPFVPADAAKFWRWRLNIPRAWAQLESSLNEVNPQFANVLNMILQTAGKDKDEKYDLKSQLLGNLSDDIAHYEKAAQGTNLAELNAAPALFLIGSPNPEKLAVAVKAALFVMGPGKDREFLGRQITTVTSLSQPPHSLNFSGSGAYVAISSDTGILEEYLRSNDNKGKSLADMPGLADAAQKVGGMNTGFFGYDNQNLNARAIMELLRKEPISLQELIGGPTGMAAGDATKLADWADFTLLPPYDSISQYFYFTVYAGVFSPEGFTLNSFSPTPPKLR